MAKNKQIRSWVWCKGGSNSFTWNHRGTRLKCLVCGQRFRPVASNSEYHAVSGGNGCWHPQMMKHKRPVKHP